MATFKSASPSVGTYQGDASYASQFIGSSGGGLSFSSIIPAITGIIGAMGQASAIEAQANATINNMKMLDDSLKFSQANSAQQLQDLQRLVGDKLSQTGFEAMQMEGRLKAATAETGGTGASINEAIITAEMNKLHQDAAIIRDYDINKSNILSSAVAERLSFENQTIGMASTLNSSTTGNLFSTLNAFGKGATIGLNMMSTSQKEKMFGINTTGSI